MQNELFNLFTKQLLITNNPPCIEKLNSYGNDEKRSSVVTVMMSLLKMFHLYNFIYIEIIVRENGMLRIGRSQAFAFVLSVCCVWTATTTVPFIPYRLLLFGGCLKNCFDLIVKMPRGRRTSPSLSLFPMLCIEDYNALTHTYMHTSKHRSMHLHTHAHTHEQAVLKHKRTQRQPNRYYI